MNQTNETKELENEIERLENIISKQTHEKWELEKQLQKLKIEIIKLKIKYNVQLLPDDRIFISGKLEELNK
jgi:hypothetical protein